MDSASRRQRPGIDPVSQYPENQGFHFGNRFLGGVPIDHRAGNLGHFGDETTIFLRFDFDLHTIRLHDTLCEARPDSD